MIRAYLAAELAGLRVTRRGRAVRWAAVSTVLVAVVVWLAPHVERRDGAWAVALVATLAVVGAGFRRPA